MTGYTCVTPGCHIYVDPDDRNTRCPAHRDTGTDVAHRVRGIWQSAAAAERARIAARNEEQ